MDTFIMQALLFWSVLEHMEEFSKIIWASKLDLGTLTLSIVKRKQTETVKEWFCCC